MRLNLKYLATLVGVALLSNTLTAAQRTDFKFDFNPAKADPGRTSILPATTYTTELGYGFDLGSKVAAIDGGGCGGGQPYFFSITLPEGNYNVTVVLGRSKELSTTTIKAESRRLMVEGVQSAPGKITTRAFTVNVRTPRIGSGEARVKLKPRELGPPLALDWDDKLTLEFNGEHPCVQSIDITRADDAVTVYLLGDSTVTDQAAEPWNSWGQMLPRFLKSGVAIANNAESGESLKSSQNAGRLEKVLSALKASDYVLIQFGHNDQKERGEGVGAFTTYKASLKHYVAEIRKHGGTPVLVTPVNRRTFDSTGKITNSLGDYPQAVRQTAEDEHVALVDLNSMSKPFYEALGPEGSKKAFVDNTHHNNYGSYELAKCVVMGMKTCLPELAKFLVDDFAPFDPAHPDPIADFKVPASPQSTQKKPEGS